MKSKKRLIITMSSLVLTAVFMVVAVSAIFASMRQNVSTTFRVRYTAKQVAATVEANYIYMGEEVALLTSSNETSIEFEPAAAETTESFVPREFEIDIDDGTAIFEYIFTNNSETADFSVELDVGGLVLNNMSLEYTYAYSNISAPKTADYTDAFEPMALLGSNKENGDYAQLYVYVKLAVDNLANDAEFYGDMLWELNNATGVSLEFENTSKTGLFAKRYVPQHVEIYSLPTPTVNGEDGVFYTTYGLYDTLKFPFTLNYSAVVFAGEAVKVNYASFEGITTYAVANVGEKPQYITIAQESKVSFSEVGTIYNLAAGETIELAGDSVIIVEVEENYAQPYAAGNGTISSSSKMPANAAGKTYISRGEYPQTYVGHDMNAELRAAVDSGAATPTGKTYQTESMHYGGFGTHIEYLYNGQKYAMIDDPGYDVGCGGVTLTSVRNEGVYVEQRWDEKYWDLEDPYVLDMRAFFIIEPVLLKIMEINNGIATVATVSAITNIQRGGGDVSTFLSDANLNDIALTTSYEVEGKFKFHFIFPEGVTPGTEAVGFDCVTYELVDESYTSKGRVVSFAELVKWSGKDIVEDLFSGLTYGGFEYGDGYIYGVWYEEYGYSTMNTLYVMFEESVYPWDIRANDFAACANSYWGGELSISGDGYLLSGGRSLTVETYDYYYHNSIIVFEMVI